MSWQPVEDPRPGDSLACDAIETVIIPRARDLGGFEVRRALPSARRQMVGPFIFWDQMGPAQFVVGKGIDVRPHPHIGLATATYLFDGEIMHRDSLGTEIAISPGALNLMTAGRGIAHSERSAGEAMGARSPVQAPMAMFQADLQLAPGASAPLDATYEERALYTVSGTVEIAGARFGPGQLLVFRPGDRITLRAADGPARVMLLGGEPMDGPRHIWWNFVSSRKDRIKQAAADWKSGRFEAVPGDAE